MTIGDRVKFQTNGGWYNSGIITSMDEKTCLVEVDTLGHDDPIPLPYYVRAPRDLLIPEYERKREVKSMTNYEWLVRNKAELVKDILSRNFSKVKGIPDRCAETMCRDCDFSCGNCTERTKEWFEKEHEPLYKKGDIVVGPFNQIFFVKKVCNDDDFVMVSSYTDSITDGHKMHINEIKKKIACIESEV